MLVGGADWEEPYSEFECVLRGWLFNLLSDVLSYEFVKHVVGACESVVYVVVSA